MSERTNASMDKLDAWTKKEAASRVKSAFVKQTVSAASGLAVYLFAGIRAFLGFISVGSVVTYAASIIKWWGIRRQSTSHTGLPPADSVRIF